MLSRCCLRFVPLAATLLIVSTPAHPAPRQPKRLNPEILAPVELRAGVTRVSVRTYLLLYERDGTQRIGIVSKKHIPAEILFVNKDELKQLIAPQFARNIWPLHVAVICGSFPYREQVEAFGKALRIPYVAELRDEPGAFPRVTGLDVQRRELSPKQTGWQALDFDGANSPYRNLFAVTQSESEPEPAQFKPVYLSGLTMPLPVLACGRYPDCTLPLLTKTLADAKARSLPDYCLLRFPDVTVEPGRTYEYRVRVRMANPNQGKKTKVEETSLAEPKELLGPWAEVPGVVALDPDLAYYAVDEKLTDKKLPGRAPGEEEVAFQVHRWIGHHQTLRGAVTPVFPVGTWVIADRILVARGEYVGDQQAVKLPIWDPIMRRHIPAENPAGGGETVDFSPDPKESAPLLVDFDRGKVAFKGREAAAPLEVLLLSADGKLLARNGEADAADPVRRWRCAEWKKWLNDDAAPP
jgi:hypothetical protein